jgi:hypothetical protein
MARVKSDNRHLGILSGYETRWRHSAVAETVTITPRAGEPAVLHHIVVGTTSSSAIIVRDSINGVILTLKASISEGTYHCAVRIKGNLIVENPGGSDILIVYSND